MSNVVLSYKARLYSCGNEGNLTDETASVFTCADTGKKCYRIDDKEKRFLKTVTAVKGSDDSNISNFETVKLSGVIKVDNTVTVDSVKVTGTYVELAELGDITEYTLKIDAETVEMTTLKSNRDNEGYKNYALNGIKTVSLTLNSYIISSKINDDVISDKFYVYIESSYDTYFFLGRISSRTDEVPIADFLKSNVELVLSCDEDFDKSFLWEQT